MPEDDRRSTHGGVAKRLWSDASAALIRELFAEGELEVADVAARFDCGHDVVRKLLTGETYAKAGGPKADPTEPRLKPYRRQPRYSDAEVRAKLLAYGDEDYVPEEETD